MKMWSVGRRLKAKRGWRMDCLAQATNMVANRFDSSCLNIDKESMLKLKGLILSIERNLKNVCISRKYWNAE